MPQDQENKSERAPKGPGWLARQLGAFYAWRDGLKAHPVLATAFAVAVLCLGIVGSEVVDRVKRKAFGPDEYLVQIAESQKKEFADLRENLGQLRNSISADDRDAFDSVQSAVKSLEGTNTQLIQQLVMAKLENDTLKKITEQKAGVAGGYDFILAENNGIRIDKDTVLGLKSVSSSYAYVSLSSLAASEPVNESLESGQSLSYQSATGKKCRVSLLSFRNGNPGTASFALGCS